MSQVSRWEVHCQRALVFLGVVFYLFVFPHGIHGDGFVRYEALLSLLNGEGIKPLIYSYVGPLVSLPLYFVGYVAKDPYWWISRFNTFVFLFAAFLLWRGFRRYWQPEAGRVFLLLLFCGTMFPRHVTDYYSEVFSACLAALAIMAFLKHRFWLGALALCLSGWNTPGTLIGAALLAGFFFFRTGSFRFLLLVPALAAGHLIENWLKTGELLATAYVSVAGEKTIQPYSGLPGFSYPWLFGFLSVIFSTGKGLIFFAPGLWAVFLRGIFRGFVGAFLLAGLVYLIGLLAVFPRWWAWSGDWFWGPRFYLFASLWGATALAAIWSGWEAGSRRRVYWVVATGFSLWVGFLGITFGQDMLQDCAETQRQYLCHYVPEFSPLWRPFSWSDLTGRKPAFAAYFFLVALALLWRPLASLADSLAIWGRAEWLVFRERLGR